MANTGIKNVLTLRKYVNGVATNEFKANVVGDPDYIAPYEDLVSCPVSGSTPTPEPPNVYTVGFRTNEGSPISSFACNTANQTLYASASSFGAIAIGTKIYSNTSGTLFSGGNLWFGIASTSGISTKTILIDNSGIVTNQGECETATPPPPPPTQAYQTVLLYEQSAGAWTNSTDACNGTGGTSILVKYISSSESLVANTVVYNDTNLSVAFDGGGNWYQDQGSNNVISIASNGAINNVTSC